MTRREMIERGRRAVVAAYPDDTARPDIPPDDWRAHICDTLVDVMHYAESLGVDVPSVVDSALGTHYLSEKDCALDEEPDL